MRPLVLPWRTFQEFGKGKYSICARFHPLLLCKAGGVDSPVRGSLALQQQRDGGAAFSPANMVFLFVWFLSVLQLLNLPQTQKLCDIKRFSGEFLLAVSSCFNVHSLTWGEVLCLKVLLTADLLCLRYKNTVVPSNLQRVIKTRLKTCSHVGTFGTQMGVMGVCTASKEHWDKKIRSELGHIKNEAQRHKLAVLLFQTLQSSLWVIERKFGIF